MELEYLSMFLILDFFGAFDGRLDYVVLRRPE